MTKLTEWGCSITAFLAIWLSLVYRKDYYFDNCDTVLYFFPVIIIFLFGMFSLIVVLWRVYCFNDCPEAAEEIKQQIQEARDDLKSKGLKF